MVFWAHARAASGREGATIRFGLSAPPDPRSWGTWDNGTSLSGGDTRCVETRSHLGRS